jgi:hypothetical protein
METENDAMTRLLMMTPEERQKALGGQLQTNNAANRNAFLQRQLEMASLLRNEPGKQYSSVPGAIFGGLGRGIDKFMNARERKQLLDQMNTNQTALEDPNKLYSDEYLKFLTQSLRGGQQQGQLPQQEAPGAYGVNPMGYGV